MEQRLGGLQCAAAAQHRRAGDVVAVVVSDPYAVLIGAGDLPGNLIAARGLFRTNRGPVARLARHKIRSAAFQGGADKIGRASCRESAEMREAGHAIRLKDCLRWAGGRIAYGSTSVHIS